ncbi:MAG: CBS domain-containing protein, partial [bacterium]|nr:CBS domain-containing protein [bacterium]
LLIKIAGIVDKYASFVGVVGHNKLDKFQIESKDELLDMVRQARGIDNGDKRAIEAQMKMAETKVKNLMVAATEVDYISYDELLGPLVLHDLHKTGHRWFPVVRNDLDSTLGFLDSRDVLTIDSKRSVKAQTAMQHETVRVKPSDNLNVALDTCLKAGSWIALVVDGDEVVGLIGLPAILNHLRGKQA